MAEADPGPELTSLAARIAREETPALVAAARAEAVAEVRELLRRSIVEALLEQAGGESPARAAPPPLAPRTPPPTQATAWYVYGVGGAGARRPGGR
jgi:hypothetical protein